jgi:hypothetical protein
MTPSDIILDAIVDSELGGSANACAALARSILARLRQGGFCIAAVGAANNVTPEYAHAREALALTENAAVVLAKDLAATPYPELRSLLVELVGALRRRERWVADLQSGLYVNCVYCGHRYGPGETTPVSMADALKAHVAQCPEHPMSALADAGVAAHHALKSYQFGNTSPDLAEDVGAKLSEALARAGRKPDA